MTKIRNEGGPCFTARGTLTNTSFADFTNVGFCSSVGAQTPADNSIEPEAAAVHCKNGYTGSEKIEPPPAKDGWDNDNKSPPASPFGTSVPDDYYPWDDMPDSERESSPGPYT